MLKKGSLEGVDHRGGLHPLDHEEVMWVLPGQLSTMDLAPADVGISISRSLRFPWVLTRI